MGNKLLISALLMVGVMVAIGYMIFTQPVQAKGVCLNETITSEIKDHVEFEAAAISLYRKLNVSDAKEACSKTDYCTMGSGKYGLPKNVFGLLPELTDSEWQRLFALRAELQKPFSFQNLAMIDPKIWKQPEFYDRRDRSFGKDWVPLMIVLSNPNTDYHVGYGYGFEKSEYYFKTDQHDANFTLSFIARAEAGVLNFQGLSFEPAYPITAYFYGGNFLNGSKDLKQDANYAQCHIAVIGINPREIALEPTFPQIHTGWAKMVTVKVQIGSLEKGKYALELLPSEPSSEFSEAIAEQYPSRYVTQSLGISGDQKVTVFIEVI